MKVSLILAVADGGVIGREGGLPWRLPADMRFFKDTTMGHPVVMGRKTWESLRKPLPGRANIVVTRQAGYQARDAQLASSFEAALELAASAATEAGVDEAFVIGGAQLYALALPRATTIYRTRVHAAVDGDVVLDWEPGSDWVRTPLVEHEIDERHAYAFTIERLERRS